MNEFKKAVKNNPKVNTDINNLVAKRFKISRGNCHSDEFTVHVATGVLELDHYDFPLVSQEWNSNHTGLKGNFFGPCETWHCQETGALVYEEYRRDGMLHRDIGPAIAFYDRDTGAIKKQRFFQLGEERFPTQSIDNDQSLNM